MSKLLEKLEELKNILVSIDKELTKEWDKLHENCDLSGIPQDNNTASQSIQDIRDKVEQMRQQVNTLKSSIKIFQQKK